MKIAVFLGYPKPFLQAQQKFIDLLIAYLGDRGFVTKTLGVTEYDMHAPLKGIRRLLLESNGLITVAFRRALVEKGTLRPKGDLATGIEQRLRNVWYTSPWAHIEPAMAFQVGLPILIFREKGVVEDGLLEKGIAGTFMPEIDLEKPMDDYFRSNEMLDLLRQWEGLVRRVVEEKGNPPAPFRW
jgi:hypothetical protein